eukprot:Skav236849  [mRNA]  locus=scaffold1027:338779:348010:+ [translate_table: standard]
MTFTGNRQIRGEMLIPRQLAESAGQQQRLLFGRPEPKRRPDRLPEPEAPQACVNFNLANAGLCDDGLIRLVLHVANSGMAESLNISDNKDGNGEITFTGVSWLFTILSWHPLYPWTGTDRKGTIFCPVRVRMENLGLAAQELEQYLDSNEFKLLCTSVNVTR